jgi:hypothetical protein
MNDPVSPREGGCRCGQVRFQTIGPELVTMACHCTGCQKMTASAFSLSTLYPADAFTVTAGEPVVGGLHGATGHLFCPHCMTWMFTRPEGGAPFVNVRATLFDDPAGYAPFMETMTAEKLPWATTPAVHSFAGFPAPQDYPAVIQAYAARAPAP